MIRFWHGFVLLLCICPAYGQTAKATVETNVHIVLMRMGLDRSVEFVSMTTNGDAVWARPGPEFARLEENFKSNRLWKKDGWLTRFVHPGRMWSRRLLVRPSIQISAFRIRGEMWYKIDIDRFPPALRKPVDATLHFFTEFCPHLLFRDSTSQDRIYYNLTNPGTKWKKSHVAPLLPDNQTK